MDVIENKESIPFTIDLNGNWSFVYTPELKLDERPVAFPALMPVPGYWDDHIDIINQMPFFRSARTNPDYVPVPEYPLQTEKCYDASLPFLYGTGWYRKILKIDGTCTDSRFILNIGPARVEANVWVNNHHVKHHLAHSTEFQIDITDFIQPGQENELILAISNTRERVFGTDTRGYKGQSGGIAGDIRLKVTGPKSIEDLYVYNQGEELIWKVALSEGNTDNVTLDWKIASLEGDNVLGQGSHSVSGHSEVWKTAAFGMKTWSDRNPNLYKLSLTLRKKGKILDRLEQRFGFRKIEADGINIKINNFPVLLRGATEHCFFPETCTLPLDKEYYFDRLTKWKALGYNWVRFHTAVPNEAYLQAADELGFFVQVEPATGFSIYEWEHILRYCRKYPSVVLYCCGNEDCLDDEKIDYLEECQDLFRELVPDALFNPQEGLRGVEYSWDGGRANFGPDENLSHTPFLHDKKRLDRLKKFSDVFGAYPLGILSYMSTTGDPQTLNHRLAIYEKPIVLHEPGILGTYIDLSLESRYEGTRITPEFYSNVRKHLKEQGLEEKAEAYYKNSCRQYYSLSKDVHENMRLCKFVTGYDWLGSYDHHWQRTGYHGGFLNEFQELKSGFTAEDILKINGESVLLLDHGKNFNLTCGQDVSFPFVVSLFGSEPIKEGKVGWRLTNHKQQCLAEGSWDVRDIPIGQNTVLGNIEWFVQSQTPQALKLSATLHGGQYELSNNWNFWMFPSCNHTLDVNGVHIVNELTEKDLELLQKGSKVILLGTAPFPSIETSFQPALAGRETGDMATVIKDHPAMKNFPHEGFCDWQFRSLRNDSCNIIFDNLDIPFDPIIDVASSYKKAIKQSVLFELKVGQGKLLVCSLNFRNDDIAAEYLKAELISYAASNTFDPIDEIKVEALKSLLRSGFTTLDKSETDMAFDVNVRE